MLVDAQQCVTPHIFGCPIELAIGIHRTLEGVISAGHLVTVRQQAGLDTVDEIGATRGDVESAPGLPQRVPKRAAEVWVVEVNLESVLF